MTAQVLLVLAGVAIVVALLRPRKAFVIVVEDEAARLASGKAPGGFVQDVQEIVASAGVTRAKVSGARAGGRVRLRFSSHVPKACRQQIRNTWETYTYMPPGTSGPDARRA